MNLPIRKLFFSDPKIRTFYITRLQEKGIEEKVFLKRGELQLDVSSHHSMICLEPFCVAIWLTREQANSIDLEKVRLQFLKGRTLNASIKVSIIEKIATPKGALLLYKIEKADNYHLTVLHRLVLFRYFLRSKKNSYNHRKVISALYSYPRSIIIVSYKDDDYYNIFPMDIQGYIKEECLYILGLRTTNVTLNKILEAKKVVVCDTDAVDIKTVYDLGKHSSTAPTQINDLPFGITESEKFGFFVPDFTASYKEIEIIEHKKMGYHMLLLGRVVNHKQIRPESSSLYHVGFLQFQNSSYTSIEGLF